MAGGALRLAPERRLAHYLPACISVLSILLVASGPAPGQSLYKYRGENGEWIYSDRPPDDNRVVEVRQLESAAADGAVTVSYRFVGDGIELIADNQFHAPIELKLLIETIRGLDYPDPDKELRWILPPRSETVLIGLDLLDTGPAPFLAYRFEYLAGDPDAVHRPESAYRVPFSIASNYPVSQAYPDFVTHTSPDSYFAVDLAMPVGTDIFAAREGVVFDVASTNFRNGLDSERDGPAANVVRILHADGTYAIYAHLNWNSIRVKPGDHVQRGEYIADSGNTGYSSGPHLHFAVVRNTGLRIESVPVVFEGANSARVTPATGMVLTAY